MIDQVTPDNVLKAAGELLSPEKSSLALIGPFREKSRFQALLKNGIS